ncbi:ubiquitin carboxyl-terminal hydrolase 36 isoform X2 [Bacillus rossius redtenbacheri]|uniref:ubiquitin carboxyl-terminal hydrolase 36 isoform X2 n=1 Tax=Bacillus rossius redtenbacheri TaxID=93214 RepID=UPI002FDCFD68
MPASDGDPVGTALRVSLAACSDARDDLDSKIVASSARILLSHIEYEACDGYKHSVLENLKSKYIVLKAAHAAGSGAALKGKPAAADMKPSSAETELPALKVTLFPAEAVQLGWRGMRPIGAGMINMGNTCYLNSTLQALFHVPALVNWLESDTDHLDKCTANGNMECTICAMAKTLKNSHSKSGGVMKPFWIYNKLKMICKHMTHGTQEDAHEFMRYLIESMEKAYLSRHKSKVLDNYSKETTPLNQIFGGYMRTEVECLQCHAVSTTFQHFQDLLLDVRRASTLDDALAGYFCKERLDGDDAYRCERCLRKVAATKKFCVQKPPLVLCLQLKRFSIMGGKINKHVSFSQHLDLTRFLCPQSASKGQPLTYRLVAMVNHMGTSINCGHYTAIAQTSSGHFYHFDDSSVRPISLAAALEANAYIIIYEMERSPHRSTPGSSKPAAATAPAPVPLGAHTNGPRLPARPPVPPVRPTNPKPSTDIVPVHGRTQPLLGTPPAASQRVGPSKPETSGTLPPLANRHKEHVNGNALTPETGRKDSYEWVEKTNAAPVENGEQKNGLCWNGMYKSSAADFLAKLSHRGYGTNGK